ncbi:MAG: adenylate/guanylate cyclase domain-containing protein [Alphaproteobacteria bacterium]|nr:adenylate/guanylate cyclase domain-containing protein [Alphaproteobacteria bacterium]
MAGIGFVVFLAQTASLVVLYFTNSLAQLSKPSVVAYFAVSLALPAGMLMLLRRRRWVEGIGIAVALAAAVTGAIAGAMMWSTFPPGTPLSALAKLPVATIGLGMVAGMTLTLRPLHVAIAGLGLGATLIVFYAIAARDPATIFAWYSAEALLGPAISPSRLILELLAVGSATTGAAVATLFARRTVREAIALQRMTDQLSRYFSPAVAGGIRDGGEAFLRPGGREQEVVVLFSDLAGFTRTCAGLPAAEALAMLSEYHERMVAEIFRAGGTLDKFIGDGIMATFGTPVPAADSADRAVQAARGMMTALADLNRDRAARGQAPLVQRIGIHAGPAVVGNVGTRQRLEFTVIGDTVNVASRIENACKQVGKAALISAAVVERLTVAVQLEPIGPLTLDGQPQPIELHALVEGVPPHSNAEVSASSADGGVKTPIGGPDPSALLRPGHLP